MEDGNSAGAIYLLAWHCHLSSSRTATGDAAVTQARTRLATRKSPQGPKQARATVASTHHCLLSK